MPNALTAFVVAFTAALPGLPRAGETGASFFEDFNVLDYGRWYVSDGWSNGDWMNCTWSRGAVSVSDGLLRLSFMKSPRRSNVFLCGEISVARVFWSWHIRGPDEDECRIGDERGLLHLYGAIARQGASRNRC